MFFRDFYAFWCFMQEDQGIYATMVKNMIQENKYRLVVNINDLRKKNPARTFGYDSRQLI